MANTYHLCIDLLEKADIFSHKDVSKPNNQSLLSINHLDLVYHVPLTTLISATVTNFPEKSFTSLCGKFGQMSNIVQFQAL